MTSEHSARFRPTRAGIVNLWDYRDEEFVFADGRLVLRGPNGSGKTKALEVLFPFVLDGRIEPRRLNPFASEERTMRSNLLYRGQESEHSYVWMEFGDGTRHVTVGVGLRASKQNDQVRRWYFVADGRVGVDFSLLSVDDRPVRQKELAEQLAPGSVTVKSTDYRAAVDERMFGLGAERYEQLLTLVLTLRRPQLAKNLDPKSLSQALTDGLRPLDPGLVAEAAGSFADMEAVQQTLANVVAADEAARSFVADYTTYVRTHARGAADRVTERLGEVSAAGDAMAAAWVERRAARAARADAESEKRAAATGLGELQGRMESLRASPAYRDREQLTKQASLVDELAVAARQAANRAAAATAAVARRREQHRTAEESLHQATAELARASGAASAAAVDAGIEWGDGADEAGARGVGPGRGAGDAGDGAGLAGGGAGDAGGVDGAGVAGDAAGGAVGGAGARGLATRAEARYAARMAEIANVRAAMSAAKAAQQARAGAETRMEQAEATRIAAVEALAVEEAALLDARERCEAALADWAQRHGSVLGTIAAAHADSDSASPQPELPEALAGIVGEIAAGSGGSLSARFDADGAPAVAGAHADTARGTEQLRAVDAELAGMQVSRDQIVAEKDDAPPRFAARVGDRADRVGAPLWQLVRFADGIDDASAAGIEAALHAANLLDAWVLPGEEIGHPDSDTVLAPLPAAQRPSSATLADVLIADDPIDVPAERVRAVLASVRFDPRPSLDPAASPAAAPTISDSGWFASGLQVGAHHTPAAQYIGATARARRRVQRLSDLDLEIAAARGRATELRETIAAAGELLGQIAAAKADLPATAAIRNSRQRVDRDAGRLAATAAAAAQARAVLDQATALQSSAEAEAHHVARARNLAAETPTLDAVAAAVEAFRRAVTDILAAHRALADRRSRHAAAAEELVAAVEAEAGDLTQADQATADQARRQAELDTLRSSIGAGAEQLDQELADTARAIRDATARTKAADAMVTPAIERDGATEQTCASACALLGRAIVECQRECTALRPFAGSELREILDVDGDLAWPATDAAWPDPTEAAEAAQRELAAGASYLVEPIPQAVRLLHQAITAATGQLKPTESSLKSSNTRVSSGLEVLAARLSAAGHDYRPTWDSPDGIIVVQVVQEAGYTPIGRFAQSIAADRREQEQLLSESERRILEDALLGRLAQQIHDRTLAARDLIDQMAREMRSRRMSSGAAVGIKWVPTDDADDAIREVNSLLARDAARLDGGDLARLRAHFAARIKDLRAARPDRSFIDILGEALDYRRWRMFQLSLIAPDGTAERLTRARHSTLSGGEQSVSLHLPLFAAAHVMLGSARPGAPRLVALDEAFAGIDDTGRGELLGMTVDFDLDLFMTGHDLWATYASVPGCAHYDLSHSAMEHTVSALLLVWNGGELAAETSGGETSLAAALGSPGTRRVDRSDAPTLGENTGLVFGEPAAAAQEAIK